MRAALLCGTVLLSAGAAAGAQTVLHLEYAASLAGAPIGEVSLRLQLTPETPSAPGRYSIAGEARSIGIWEAFQSWRGEYSAAGEIVNGQPQPESYWLSQHTPRKARDVRVAAGVLHETKNGKVRDPRPAPPGLDVLSGFFVEPRCAAARDGMDVNTGRYPYRITLSKEDPSQPQRVC